MPDRERQLPVRVLDRFGDRTGMGTALPGILLEVPHPPNRPPVEPAPADVVGRLDVPTDRTPSQWSSRWPSRIGSASPSAAEPFGLVRDGRSLAWGPPRGPAAHRLRPSPSRGPRPSRPDLDVEHLQVVVDEQA